MSEKYTIHLSVFLPPKLRRTNSLWRELDRLISTFCTRSVGVRVSWFMCLLALVIYSVLRVRVVETIPIVEACTGNEAITQPPPDLLMLIYQCLIIFIALYDGRIASHDVLFNLNCLLLKFWWCMRKDYEVLMVYTKIILLSCLAFWYRTETKLCAALLHTFFLFFY